MRVCVSTRPAVTAPSSWARGLPAPGRCVGRGRPATPRASPAGEGPPRAPDLARPCPTCPGELGRAPGRERKALPLGRAGRSGAAEDKEEEAIAAARLSLRRAESPPPGARPRQPLLRNFFFWVRPTRKVRPGRGEAGGRAGFAAAAAAAGEEEVVPARARPGRGNARPARPPPAPVARLAPGPRPAATLAGRARRGSGGGGSGGRCGPAARRSQQCGAGKTKGFHFACVPVSHLRSRGAARDPLPAGAAPLGARSRARPVFPVDPPVPSPAPAPQAPGPVRSDSRSRGIRPYCPRGAPRARPGSLAAPARARAPTGLGEREPGAPRKPSPRGRHRRCPPDAAALGVSFFFCQS